MRIIELHIMQSIDMINSIVFITKVNSQSHMIVDASLIVLYTLSYQLKINYIRACRNFEG